MTEQPVAGWGVSPWLPPGIQRRMIESDVVDARMQWREERDAKAVAEWEHEQACDRALAVAIDALHAQGESLSPAQMVRMTLPETDAERDRRTQDAIAFVLQAAQQQYRREQEYEATHPRPSADAERLECFVDEPQLLTSRSQTGWKIFQRARRFHDLQVARKRLAEAERAAEWSRNDYAVPGGGVSLRSREPARPPNELATHPLALEDTRRAEAGVGPVNVPWSQVSEWAARGWRP